MPPCRIVAYACYCSMSKVKLWIQYHQVKGITDGKCWFCFHSQWETLGYLYYYYSAQSLHLGEKAKIANKVCIFQPLFRSEK